MRDGKCAHDRIETDVHSTFATRRSIQEIYMITRLTTTHHLRSRLWFLPGPEFPPPNNSLMFELNLLIRPTTPSREPEFAFVDESAESSTTPPSRPIALSAALGLVDGDALVVLGSAPNNADVSPRRLNALRTPLLVRVREPDPEGDWSTPLRRESATMALRLLLSVLVKGAGINPTDEVRRRLVCGVSGGISGESTEWLREGVVGATGLRVGLVEVRWCGCDGFGWRVCEKEFWVGTTGALVVACMGGGSEGVCRREAGGG